MRRTWLILTVLALVLYVVPSAGAAPNCDNLPPDHPKCAGNPGGGDDLEGGFTCSERATADYFAAEVGDFDIPEQDAGFYCIDVSEVGAGDWQVDFKVNRGTLRSLILQVRDSVAPGDVCDQQRFGAPDRLTEGDGTQMTLAVDAGDWVNACGVTWAEQIGGIDYWEEDPSFRHPLAFMVFAQGSRDLRLEFMNVSVP